MPNRHFLRSDIFTFVIVYSFYFRLFFPNELNSYPLTFDWLLVIVRLLIRLTEVSGMNHLKEVGVFSTEINILSDIPEKK